MSGDRGLRYFNALLDIAQATHGKASPLLARVHSIAVEALRRDGTDKILWCNPSEVKLPGEFQKSKPTAGEGE